jgi:segregation and condensation protein B
VEALQADYEKRGIELKQVASGFRIQARAELAPWLNRLWEESPPRYSRALIETLTIIAYRQPITRAEIEDLRGVSVSTNIIRTLLDREWIRVASHRDVPGRPAVYTTTPAFLDYFNLRNLEELPGLLEAKEIEGVQTEIFPETEAEVTEPPMLSPPAQSTELKQGMMNGWIFLVLGCFASFAACAYHNLI